LCSQPVLERVAGISPTAAWLAGTVRLQEGQHGRAAHLIVAGTEPPADVLVSQNLDLEAEVIFRFLMSITRKGSLRPEFFVSRVQMKVVLTLVPS
jgi:hypothetical protein